MNNEKFNYLAQINNINFNDLENELIDYANINNVPIIKKEGLAFLLQIIKIKKPKRILEIGTAIGFSAIMMANNSDAIIDTLEKNSEMADLANKNILKANLDKRINVHNIDALLFETEFKYDLIFIDAAKTKYIEYFTKFEEKLNQNGIIICDNLLFHDLFFTSEITKNQQRIINKIDKFNHFVTENSCYDSYIYPIGDGMSLSIRKV